MLTFDGFNYHLHKHFTFSFTIISVSLKPIHFRWNSKRFLMFSRCEILEKFLCFLNQRRSCFIWIERPSNYMKSLLLTFNRATELNVSTKSFRKSILYSRARALLLSPIAINHCTMPLHLITFLCASTSRWILMQFQLHTKLMHNHLVLFL